MAKFELLVERTLYKHIVQQINTAWKKGIRLHVMGFGSLRFYPCIAFFCGDDPCQHRISGIQESNTRHGCVYCLYPTLTGVIYDPAEHLPRDVTELKRLCAIAEEITCLEGSDALKLPVSDEQQHVLSVLKYQNVHPHANPFHYAEMGADNDIYRANPPDLLHLFCAGLMKGMTQWILTIILEINVKGNYVIYYI